MKPEEAIFWVKDTKYIYENMNPDMELSRLKCEAFDTAIQSLEKQVPKKPRYYMDMYSHERPGCPECPRNEILYAGQKYCKVCGTKIDWSDPKHD